MAIKVFVDWDNTGDFSNPYSNITSDVMKASWFRGFRNPFMDVADEPECSITVRNLDGKYLPEGSGPLAGKILPQRRVRISTPRDGWTLGKSRLGVDTELSATVTLWTGWLDDIGIDWSVGPVLDPVELKCRGPIQMLHQAEIQAEYFDDVKPPAVIKTVLEQVFGDQLNYTQLEGTFTNALTVNDYDSSQDAMTVLNDMAILERGRLIFDRDNTPVFYDRDRLRDIYNDTGDNTIYVIRVQPGDNGNGVVDIDYTYGSNFITAVKVTSSPKSSADSEVLWTLENSISIPEGETKSFFVDLHRSTGQVANVSGSFTIDSTTTPGTTTITAEALGSSAKVTIENTGSGTAIVTALTLAAVHQYDQNSFAIEVERAEDVAIYGKRFFNISVSPTIPYSEAENIALYELDRLAHTRSMINSMSWQVKHIHSWEYLDAQPLVLADIAVSDFSHSGFYVIIGERYEHVNSHPMKVHLIFEPAYQTVAWVLGESTLGEDTVLSL